MFLLKILRNLLVDGAPFFLKIIFSLTFFFLKKKCPRTRWTDQETTWYHMHIAVIGIKRMITGHAAWDITAIVPKMLIIKYVNHASRPAIS